MNFTFEDWKAKTASFKEDLIEGLNQAQKMIPPMHLYNRQGSDLFEQICELDEYYVTRTELEILNAYAEDICSYLPPNSAIIEYGSGAHKKIRKLLENSNNITHYIPIDISKDFLYATAKELSAFYPKLHVHAICANYLNLDPKALKTSCAGATPVVFFPGSTIGNLVEKEANDLLELTSKVLGNNGIFILGIDLQKDEEVLVRAYDDPKQITAQFNLNMIDRMVENYCVELDKSQFEHVAIFNRKKQRIEMHLKAREDISFEIDGQHFELQKDETIHTECSHKYNLDEFENRLKKLGMHTEAVYTDTRKHFAVLTIRNSI